MDKVAIIKSNIKMDDILDHYGIYPIRNSFYNCPFHTEKTPSAKKYRNSFHCFGCGVHYSVIDFVMNYEKVDISEAIKLIDSWFNLGFDRKLTDKEKVKYKQRQRLKAIKKQEEIERKEKNRIKYIKLCDYIKLIEYFIEDITPDLITEEFMKSDDAITLIYFNSQIKKLDEIRRNIL